MLYLYKYFINVNADFFSGKIISETKRLIILENVRTKSTLQIRMKIIENVYLINNQNTQFRNCLCCVFVLYIIYLLIHIYPSMKNTFQGMFVYIFQLFTGNISYWDVAYKHIRYSVYIYILYSIGKITSRLVCFVYKVWRHCGLVLDTILFTGVRLLGWFVSRCMHTFGRHKTALCTRVKCHVNRNTYLCQQVIASNWG